MMKVVAIIGSPRKRGNTDILVGSILEGANSQGHNIEKHYLYDLDIGPCIDCRKCQADGHECYAKDDMEGIYCSLRAADVIIFGTPLYWYGASAPMKAFIDRLRPFVSSRGLEGKKAVVVIPSEEGADACSHLMGMFKLSFRYLGIELLDSILAKAYEKGEVAEQKDLIQGAFELGSNLGLTVK
ncbi:MAG: flavodoxin family protein [Candidatus Methanofastidiosa archaeon]|nr:flavodoxin family protein [Candidatus Methanofastidiosa archaeon]